MPGTPVLASQKLSTAPNAVAPNVLPSERANSIDEVTLPRSDQLTISWIIISDATDNMPMPKPKTSDPQPERKRGGEDPRTANTSAPPGNAAPPSSIPGRSPSRITRCVDSVAPIGQPST